MSVRGVVWRLSSLGIHIQSLVVWFWWKKVLWQAWLGGKLLIIYRLHWAFTGYLHDSWFHRYNQATYIYICQEHFLTAIGKEDAAVDIVHHIECLQEAYCLVSVVCVCPLLGFQTSFTCNCPMDLYLNSLGLCCLLKHTSRCGGDSTRDIISTVFGMSWLQGVMAVQGAADPIVN